MFLRFGGQTVMQWGQNAPNAAKNKKILAETPCQTQKIMP